MKMNRSRRRFLRTAPVAAVASLSLADLPGFAARPPAEGAGSFQVFTAETLAGDVRALEAKPGNNNLVTLKEFLMVLTVETAHSAKEFEWHEGRDHVVHILDGSTIYEVGGKPQSGRNTKPGEWLAPASEGATTLTLKKGDMLTIPRGTPHKRSTTGTVTFILISPQGTVTG